MGNEMANLERQRAWAAVRAVRSNPNPNPDPDPNPNPNPSALNPNPNPSALNPNPNPNPIQVRAVLSVRQTTLLLRLSHCWRVWSLAASLPVLGLGLARFGFGFGLGLGLGLGLLSLRQQREHGVHMRLQVS